MGMEDRAEWNDSAHMRAQTTLTLARSADAAIGVTRVRSDQENTGRTDPYEPQAAHLVVLQLRAFSRQTLWLDGKPAPVAPFKKGGMAIYNLDRLWIADLEDKYDTLHFYIPQAALDEVSDELGGRSNSQLHLPPHETLVDPAVEQIGHLLLPALARPQDASMLFVEHLTMALQAHLLKRYGSKAVRDRRPTGGLAAWQERRATDYLLAHLAEDISLDEASKQCGLSKSHFIKAFREKTGLPPHQWVISQRIERAKHLMKSTDLALTEIAFACGFSDQSHFSRLFGRAEGVPPSTWRLQWRATLS